MLARLQQQIKRGEGVGPHGRAHLLPHVHHWAQHWHHLHSSFHQTVFALYLLGFTSTAICNHSLLAVTLFFQSLTDSVRALTFSGCWKEFSSSGLLDVRTICFDPDFLMPVGSSAMDMLRSTAWLPKLTTCKWIATMLVSCFFLQIPHLLELIDHAWKEQGQLPLS